MKERESTFESVLMSLLSVCAVWPKGCDVTVSGHNNAFLAPWAQIQIQRVQVRIAPPRQRQQETRQSSSTIDLSFFDHDHVQSLPFTLKSLLAQMYTVVLPDPPRWISGRAAGLTI